MSSRLYIVTIILLIESQGSHQPAYKLFYCVLTSAVKWLVEMALHGLITTGGC